MPVRTEENAIHEEIKVDLKAEIHVIIQFKHFGFLDFSQRILKLKYIKK